MSTSKRSVSALVQEWRELQNKCMSDLDAADKQAFDDIAERYGDRITRMERLIAGSDPENVEDIAAMLDVVLNALELEAEHPDEPPLIMVRKVRSKIQLLSRQ